MDEPTPDHHPVRVAIVGGGFAGFTLLIGLLKYVYIDATLYESADAPSELGAGVVLGPNSQRAMSLIDPRIVEAYQGRAILYAAERDQHGLYT